MVGIEYQELEVALDGITVMVNSASTIECLTTADLYAIFGPESDGINSTTDANALSKKVGGAGDMPAQDLEITAPGEESGTYDAFLDLVGIEDFALENGVAEDAAAALRPDYQSSPNDNVIIPAIQGSPSAIGFVGFAFAEDAGDEVKELEIYAGDGCVSPTADTIADASYPLSRTLYIYLNVTSASRTAALQEFVDFYLTERRPRDRGRGGRLHRSPRRSPGGQSVGLGVGGLVTTVRVRGGRRDRGAHLCHPGR